MTSNRPLLFCSLLWIGAYVLPVHSFIAPSVPSQMLMCLGWGIALTGAIPSAVRLPRTPDCLGVLLVLLGLALAAGLDGDALGACVLLLAAAVFLAGASETQPRLADAVLAATLAAGLVSLPLAGLQAWADPAAVPDWVPMYRKAAGRAVGFLGQPNLFATLLAWSLVALMALAARRGWHRAAVTAAAFALGMGIELTGSRTGLLELLAIGAWALLGRSLPRPVRLLPLAAAAGAVAGLALSWAAAHWGHAVFAAEVRAAGHSDISGSRFPVWRDTLVLLREHGLAGVGWGGFNFAWSFSEIPGRHPVQFSHTHNLVLQLAVELGLPAAVLVLAVPAWAAWRARRGLQAGVSEDPVLAQAAAAALAVIGVHSMLEYPLWYAYYLLPTAFWLGTLLRLGRVRPASAEAPPQRDAYPLQAMGVLIVLGTLYASWDFSRVLQIYQPFGQARLQPAEQRIANGRRSLLFGAFADYALVLTADHPSEVIAAFERPLQHLVDTPLLIAYAKAYAERGEPDKARYIAQRIREFQHPASAEFLAACQQPASAQAFQCQDTPVHLRYEDFSLPDAPTARP